MVISNHLSSVTNDKTINILTNICVRMMFLRVNKTGFLKMGMPIHRQYWFMIFWRRSISCPFLQTWNFKKYIFLTFYVIGIHYLFLLVAVMQFLGPVHMWYGRDCNYYNLLLYYWEQAKDKPSWPVRPAKPFSWMVLSIWIG